MNAIEMTKIRMLGTLGIGALLCVVGLSVMGAESTTASAILPSAAAVSPAMASARALSDLTKARSIFKEQQDAVVVVTSAISMEVDGTRQEDNGETVGTVINSRGLTVVSCMKVDPIFTLNDLLKNEPGSASIQGSVSKLRIQLANGTEIPAKIVYHDAELDLALIAPDTEKPVAPFVHVTLGDGAELDVLEPLLSIVRLSPVYNRRAALGRCTVAAKLEGKQGCYILTGDGGAQHGAPLFKADGTIAGILLMHRPSLELDVESDNGVLVPVKQIRKAVAIVEGAAEAETVNKSKGISVVTAPAHEPVDGVVKAAP